MSSLIIIPQSSQMKFSIVTLSAILFSTAIAAPMAVADPEAVAVANAEAGADADPFLSIFLGAAAIGLASGAASVFDHAVFGDRFFAVGARFRNGHFDNRYFEQARRNLYNLAGTVPNYRLPQINNFDDIGTHLQSIGQRYQGKDINAPNFGDLADITSGFEVVAPPQMFYRNRRDAGDRFLVYGSQLRRNPRRFTAEQLRILMRNAAQIHVLLHRSPYGWNPKQQYNALFFADMYTQYGNYLRNNQVPDSFLPSINSNFGNLRPLF